MEGKEVRGRVYISEQGINAQYGGVREDAEGYARWLAETQPLFKVSGVQGLLASGMSGRYAGVACVRKMHAVVTALCTGSTHSCRWDCTASPSCCIIPPLARDLRPPHLARPLTTTPVLLLSPPTQAPRCWQLLILAGCVCSPPPYWRAKLSLISTLDPQCSPWPLLGSPPPHYLAGPVLLCVAC